MPGVGHFGHCLSQFAQAGYTEPILKHIRAGKPFFGICVGLQALFEGSEEDTAVPGFGVLPGRLAKFNEADKAVPHIGWNSANYAPLNADPAEEAQSLYVAPLAASSFSCLPT